MHERLVSDEQAALRRVATRVAEGATPAHLFAAVVDEVARGLGVPRVMFARYEPDRSITVLAALDEPGFVPGSRWALDDAGVAALVFDTGAPARIDDVTSEVGVPIVVFGSLWGVIRVVSHVDKPLPADTGERLREFTELVALAISNAESRTNLQRLVAEQASLRRVATRVAEGATTAELGSLVLEEVAQALAVSSAWLVRYVGEDSIVVEASRNDPTFAPGTRWPLDGDSVSARIFASAHPERIDDYSGLPGTLATRTRESGVHSVAGTPIIVDGVVWGCICVGSSTEPLPADTEARLRDFTELVATALTKAASDDRLRVLVDEQLALRRVATLVAEGADPAELFAAVAQESASVVGVSSGSVSRFGPDGFSVVLASYNDPGFPVGSRWEIAKAALNATILETGGPARVDQELRSGAVAEASRISDVRTAVGVPIIVDGSVWGMVAVGRQHSAEPLPPETETRLAAFTELVATAITNAESQARLRLLADEQAALHRVAALVARAAPPGEILSAVAEEASRILELPFIEVVRYEGDETGVVIAASGDHAFPAGSRWSLDGPSVMAAVHRSGRPERIADYSRLPGQIADVARAAGFASAIGAPIVVDGVLWGVIIAISTQPEPIPEGTEDRLGLFTELVATAVSNVQARDDLEALASQQAALRRVATLAAEGASAEELFAAVARAVARVLEAPAALIARFEPNHHIALVATSVDEGWIEPLAVFEEGGWSTEDGVISAVRATGRAARIDDYSELGGEAGERARAGGAGSGCAVPIFVDNALWGAITVFSRADDVLPADTETRLHEFTELVGTAVSNAVARAELIASRARIVAAGDEARRRIERDLHDGTQQRLIALGLDLQRIRAALHEDDAAAVGDLERVEDDLMAVLEEVRDVSRGLHPSLLARRGLLPSLRALARRSPIPVEIDVELPERPPETVETALYYVVSEALTNAAKHSHASTISVSVSIARGGGHDLAATIADDGIGGAEPSAGSGLTGLADRIDALGGTLELESPPGLGTRISILLPLTAPVRPEATR